MAIINAFGVLGITSITIPTDNLRVFSSSSSPATILDSSGAFLSLPPGTLIFHCGENAPAGFLKANGANISRNVYSALFATLGTTFGVGDGSTTFSVPDMRGEFPRGWDDARGIDSGRGFGTAQTDAFQNHKHRLDSQEGTPTTALANTNIGSGTGTSGQNYDTGGALELSSGSPRTAAETRPRNIALLACIKF
jgi:phage-related tail fiber protein